MHYRNVLFLWGIINLVGCGENSSTDSGANFASVSPTEGIELYIDSLGNRNGVDWTALYRSKIRQTIHVTALVGGSNARAEVYVASRVIHVRYERITQATLIHELGHQLEYDATGRIAEGEYANSHINADACVAVFNGRAPLSGGICYL